MCQGCHNIQNSIRRNLGDSAEMSSWSAEESLAFFKRLTNEKRAAGDGTLSWKTVRAAMVTTLTEQKISSFSTNVDAEELPLTVYQARGWSDEIIKRFPSFHSDEYGCEVYRVPVRRLNWKEEFANIENRILQKEQDFAQKKGKGAAKLDVPQEKEAPAEAGEKGAARKAAAAEKKVAAQNERVANLAARALGPLSGAESAVTKLLAKAAKAESHDPAALKLCEEQLKVGEEWSKAARVAVNQQQENNAHESQSGTEVREISPLPFTAEDLKIYLKTTGEAQKSLRSSLPQPKAKAKAAAAAAAAEGTEEPKPKRRRAKSAAWEAALACIRGIHLFLWTTWIAWACTCEVLSRSMAACHPKQFCLLSKQDRVDSRWGWKSSNGEPGGEGVWKNSVIWSFNSNSYSFLLKSMMNGTKIVQERKQRYEG